MSARDDDEFWNSPAGSRAMLWIIPIFTVPFFLIGMYLTFISGSMMVFVFTIGLSMYGAEEWHKHHRRLSEWHLPTSDRTRPTN